MLPSSFLAVGVTLLFGNALALPADFADLETRDAAMITTVNSYVSQLIAAGFIPNAKATTRKRDLEAIGAAPVQKRNTPDIRTVLTLLEGHGFEPAKGNHKARDFVDTIDAPSFAHRAAAFMTKRAIAWLPERAVGALTRRALKSIGKRDIPDLALVVSCLERQGFYPHTATATKRSLSEERGLVPDQNLPRSVLEERQSSGDINTVINQLIAYGYNPSDFGPTASKILSSFLSGLPTETTASCPKDNNTLYSTNGVTYEIGCNMGFTGADLVASNTPDFKTCLTNCAKNSQCVAASFLAVGDPNAYCHMKWAIVSIETGYSYDAGRSAGRIIARS